MDEGPWIDSLQNSSSSSAPMRSEGRLPTLAQMQATQNEFHDNRSQTNVYAPTHNIQVNQSVDPLVTEFAQQTMQHTYAQAESVVGAVVEHATEAVKAAHAETQAQNDRASYAENVAREEHARRIQAEAVDTAAEKTE